MKKLVFFVKTFFLGGNFIFLIIVPLEIAWISCVGGLKIFYLIILKNQHLLLSFVDIKSS